MGAMLSQVRVGPAVPQRILDIVSWAKRRHCRFKGECRPWQMGKKSFRIVAVAKMGSRWNQSREEDNDLQQQAANSC